MTELELLQLRLSLANIRLDANETANLDRAFRYVATQVYNVEYAELRHRRYIPQDNSVPPGAESIWFRQHDSVGKAKLISNWADDLPRVDVIATEYGIPVKAVGDSFGYSQMDLLRAAMPNGLPLDRLRAQAARDAIEWELDDIACIGRPDVKIKGFINNDAVDVMTAATVSSKTKWITDTKDPAAIIADLNALKRHVVVDTKQLYAIDTILLPSDLYEYAEGTPYSAYSDKTILTVFRGNNPGITIEAWSKLDLANADGDGGRIIAYRKSPQILEEKIPMEYTQLPAQPKNLEFVVNAWAITGGVHIHRPKAVVYMDGAS
jgi:hypothetical protein